MTIDLYNDPGHARLRHLLDRHPRVAEFVKHAEFEDDLSRAPATVFAAPDERLYPVHTPHHAAVSYLYAKVASIHPYLRDAIKVAVDAYGLPAEMFEAVEVKLAAPAEDDCLFPASRTYPVRTADEVKTAEERLLAQLPKLGLETRAQVFGRLYKAAEAHGVALRADSYRYAGVTKTAAKPLVDELRARAAATTDARVSGKFAQLADAIKARPRELRARATQVKLAAVIADLDEQGGLTAKYGAALPDPVRAVFNTDERSDKLGIDLAGTDVPMEKLMSLDPSFYGDVLGPDVIREIAPTGHLEPEKLAAVVETLPLDLKRTLATALRSAGA